MWGVLGKAIMTAGQNEAARVNKDIWERLYRSGNYLQYPSEQLVRLFCRHVRGRIPEGALVIDHGAGSGNNAEFFVREGCQVLVTDISEEALEIIGRRFFHLHLPVPRRHLVQPGDNAIDSLPQCDVMVFWDVLNYNSADNARAMLRAGIGRLRPGGFLLVNMPTPRHHFIANAREIAPGTFEFKGEDQQGAIMCTPGSTERLAEWCAGVVPVEVGGFSHHTMQRCSEFMYLVGRKG